MIDAPELMASPQAFCSTRIRKPRRVQSYRYAECPPRPESLKGSLHNEGFVYLYASRASALVFPLVSVSLAPKVS